MTNHPNRNRSHYVLIAKGSGLYMWGGKYASKEAAFEDFDGKVGIDPHDRGLDVVAAEDFVTYRVTPAQFRAVEKWHHEQRSDASLWPLEDVDSE